MEHPPPLPIAASHLPPVGKSLILDSNMRRKLYRAYATPLELIQQRLPPLRRYSNPPTAIHFQQFILDRFFLHASILPGFIPLG